MTKDRIPSRRSSRARAALGLASGTVVLLAHAEAARTGSWVSVNADATPGSNIVGAFHIASIR